MSLQPSKQMINRPDWWVVIIYLLLVAFGWMNIYSTQSGNSAEIFDISKKHGAQLMWIVIAFVSAAAVMIINNKFYSVFANYIYGGVILLLMAVLVVGTEVNGSKSWLSFGPLRFQPAELAKLATSLALARFMSAHDFKINTSKNWLVIIGLIAAPVLLILLQKDWGSALVFSAFMLMLYREGMSGWVLAAVAFFVGLFIATLLVQNFVYIMIVLAVIALIMLTISYKDYVPTLLAGGATLVLFAAAAAYKGIAVLNVGYDVLLCFATIAALIVWMVYAFFKHYKSNILAIAFFIVAAGTMYSVDYVYDNVLKPHHRDRIEDMLGIKTDIKGAGYNVYQAKVAIGSGGFAGKGYLQGPQTKLNFVPEQSTDFIFCTVGEEWGFIGSFTLIMLFVALLVRIIMLAERRKDRFARIYGYCVASIMFFHFAVNIAMTVGLAPVVGIPLPFISAGGSSLWSFTMLLFIFLKLNAVRYSYE